MSYDFPDGPDYNPEPQGDEYATPAEDPSEATEDDLSDEEA